MSVCFNSVEKIKDFFERGGYEVTLTKQDVESHWLIIGYYTKLPIGCCSDRMDVLFEEPDSTFQLINRLECPVCIESGTYEPDEST